MTDDTKTNYTKKLAAWLHDPAEKQLILMRDREGHEGGTSRRLRQALDISAREFDKRADHLAAAADRPSWPRGDDAGRYPQFEAVRFSKEAELIHPLSGERLKLGSLESAVGVDQIKAASQAHFESLIQGDDDRKTFLAFWRFGPEAGQHASELGVLWPMLPADSRIPDHSIWSHVDTVSAIHTALMGDEQGPDQPALLVMSFGPVQGFIGQARSTSDLWAGSHLLSSLVWEAMKPIVSHLGPDTMVFPALRGVPVVDQWLMETGGKNFTQLFENIDSELLSDNTDTNPLFAASLPNKFMAIVPSRQAGALAEKAIGAIRQAAKSWTREAAQRAFEAAGVALTDITRAQVDEQLAGFPEACWAAASWPIDGEACKDVTAASTRLHTALDTIHPELKKQGIFQDNIWKVLTKELKLEGLSFWQPNTGILYPAVYELAERSLGAAKATRPFAPVLEEGHRCTLTGEAEWLTHDRTLLGLNRKERDGASVWGKLVKAKKTWVKPGEHLSAIATLKRLWPTLFAERVSRLTGGNVRRFVVSTHALALSTTLEKLAEASLTTGLTTSQQAALLALASPAAQFDPVTLPKALMRKLHRLPQAQQDTLKRLPALLEDEQDATDGSYHLDATLRQLLGDSRPETYYALILMDGDRMGGWLAGNEDDYKLQYRQTWHSKVLAEMDKHERRDAHLKAYLDAKRPVSPGRHGAISQALNDFSTRLARHAVEECCKGKLLYAGGDDVLALVAVDDLFDCMQLLRLAYSGIAPDESMGLGEHLGALQAGSSKSQQKLLLKNGFGLLKGRLMTLMGQKATASMGAVVAHHTAPLGMVLRELRAAESRAKNTVRGKRLTKDKEGDINRDAFCLRVLKRGGGEVNITSPWWKVEIDKDGEFQAPDTSQSALALMRQLATQLALTDFSRGAIYRAQLWFEGLTDNASDATNPAWRAQMTSSLAYQFNRQKGEAAVARRVVDFVCDVMKPQHPKTAIENFLVTSEFFAREARSFRPDKQTAPSLKTEEERA
ncbi:type III-B CRISPR-associated protein Cas10/Cmr2 [Polaromonas sp.]|uniref:type III-B CRISPR-associated protein Cas10/Cmr2 n=1 Tax=Polaromonas sp. TaxID=1869339 RepID=UPI003BB719C6